MNRLERRAAAALKRKPNSDGLRPRFKYTMSASQEKKKFFQNRGNKK